MCGCDNQTYVCGDTYGGLDMSYVVALTEPKEEKEIRVGTEAPRRRTTRMIDVDIILRSSRTRSNIHQISNAHGR